MAVALFIETEAISEGLPQYLIFPTPEGVAAVLSRVTDGGRKGSNVWGSGALPDPEAHLTREPSALLVTAIDVAQFAARGVPTNLATKAQAAHARAPEVNGMTFGDLGDVVAMVEFGAPTLDRWIRDGRRRTPVATTPVAPAVTAPPVAPVAPAAPAETAVVTSPEEVVPQAVPSTASPRDSGEFKVCFVPPMAVAKKYVHRKIRGVEDFAVFDGVFAKGHNIALYGPTGSAKTTAALAYSAERGKKVAMVSGSVTLEPGQIFGQYTQDERTGGFRWQDGIVTEIVRDGGTIILDEINFIPGKIATVLFPLLQNGTRHLTLLDHGGETIKAHPDVVIFATWNPHYAGTLDMNAALRNRFAAQIEWGYDKVVERRLVKSGTLRDIAAKLRKAEVDETIHTPTSTNSLIEFAEFAEVFGVEFAVGNFLDRFDEDEKPHIRQYIDASMDALNKDFSNVEQPAAETPEPDEQDQHDDDADAIRTLADLGL